MALGSIQNFGGRKGDICVGMTTLPSSCTEIWEPQPSGTLRACPDLYKDCFIFYPFHNAREQVMFYRIRNLYPPAQTITVAMLRGTKKGTLCKGRGLLIVDSLVLKIEKRTDVLRKALFTVNKFWI